LVKAIVIVKGNVQGVGYRVFVRLVARRLKIKGLIRNLEDGSVEIFAEGSKNAIKQFSKGIVIKGRSEDPLSLHIEDLHLCWEGESGYQPAWREYSGFDIDYGAGEFRPAEKEMLESLEWSKLHFSGMSRVFREELSNAKKDLKNETKGVRNEIRDLHGDVSKSFEEMAKRYDTISSELVKTRKELKRTVDGLLKVIKEFVHERHHSEDSA